MKRPKDSGFTRPQTLKRIGAAAAILRMCNRTLIRAEKQGRITFARDKHGARWISREDLERAHVLTFGLAASLIGWSYDKLRYRLPRFEQNHPNEVPKRANGTYHHISLHLARQVRRSIR